MKVFIGWSGDVSRHVAKSLRDWLEHVDQALFPWMSDTDIEAGEAWRLSVDEQLKGEDTSAGIFCITPDTESARWIYYEAGHIAALKRRVIPYAFGYQSVGDVPEPWASLQVKMATKDGTREIVEALCKLHDGNLEVVSKAFEHLWPELEKSLQNTPKKTSPKVRPEHEKFDEVLERLRNIEARLVAEPVSATPKKRSPPVARGRSARNRVPMDPRLWELETERMLESIRRAMDSPEMERLQDLVRAQSAQIQTQVALLKLQMPELFSGSAGITEESRSEDEQEEGEDEEEPNEKE